LPSDPAAQSTGAKLDPAFFAYSDNYLIDVKFGVIMDVAASRAIRQAEVGAAKTMIERTQERFGIMPERLAGTAYGSAAALNWIINEKKIVPHIPMIDKSKSEDGTFHRDDFMFDKDSNASPDGRDREGIHRRQRERSTVRLIAFVGGGFTYRLSTL
jgi:hypothetical protein